MQSFLRKSSEQCVQEESCPVLRGEHVGAGAPEEGGREGKREGQPLCNHHAQDVGVSKAQQAHGLGLKPQLPLCPNWWVQNLGTEVQCPCAGCAVV